MEDKDDDSSRGNTDNYCIYSYRNFTRKLDNKIYHKNDGRNRKFKYSKYTTILRLL